MSLASNVELEPSTVLELKVLAVVGMAAALGVVGGAARLARNAPGGQPAVPASLFVAAIAAVAAFYVFDPTSPLKFISACIIAGYAIQVAEQAIAATGVQEEGVPKVSADELRKQADKLRQDLAVIATWPSGGKR